MHRRLDGRGEPTNRTFHRKLRGDFQIEGERVARDEAPPRAHWSRVSPGYLETLGLRVLRGRAFTSVDRDDSLPVVIVNQAVVDEHFPNKDPVRRK